MTASTKTFNDVISFIRKEFDQPEAFVGLHEPLFAGNERKYLIEAVDSTFVSSVGKFVDLFEQNIRDYTGAGHAVATVNGSAALHIALLLAGVKPGDLVITQPLTFIATCNAIKYAQAEPVFVDIDLDTLGLSPVHLRTFLKENTIIKSGELIHKSTLRKIAACVPMHTFGHPVHLDELLQVCQEYNLPVVEDAAESLGSQYKNKQTGTFGLIGTYSFNGNKTITCGGGGMIVTNNGGLAKLAKHLTTQAKKPHPWDFDHDHVGYNYRMPNINAALGCGQLEMLDRFLDNKRKLANRYKTFFKNSDISFVDEPANCKANFWLNAVLLKDRTQRDLFLKETNANKVMTRPSWTLMNKLSMFSTAITSDLTNCQYVEDRLVNIPSSPRVS
jgi:aminotransferase in exopolysaccharide biosynthesis